ncbi:uncharacterized protein PHALS_10132 [Plasmopara halstedii]|uniref:Uncharacterized protein n=1 Tax=Plasmopara halstedii TaxID=4781 RepID=A0A0P1AHD0_PLAHL|nr:uncharacterized protein PHALS_10132 [Plasmopara halstedii]CEG39905.1 hypothetical protein PHALS_10132 [Plasmopara halstedii]|eukprot:XP_024576274.1 hypothetical protein PHALS_10132 [Plasmopara halstedii]
MPIGVGNELFPSYANSTSDVISNIRILCNLLFTIWKVQKWNPGDYLGGIVLYGRCSHWDSG